MGELIDLDDLRPLVLLRATCKRCRRTWIAMAPSTADFTRLECGCGAMESACERISDEVLPD